MHPQEVDAAARAAAIDWLAELARRLRLSSDAVFLAVQLLDRYLAAERLAFPQQLHLASLAALWSASKYEEALSPPAAAFLAASGDVFTLQQLRNQEAVLLAALGFRLSLPTAKTFLRRALQRLPPSRATYFLSGYLAELSLLDYSLLRFPPSCVAASAFVWALVLQGAGPSAPAAANAAGYSIADIAPCVRELAELHAAASCAPQPCNVSSKYLDAGMECVASIQPLVASELHEVIAGAAATSQRAAPEAAPAGCCSAGATAAAALPLAPLTMSAA